MTVPLRALLAAALVFAGASAGSAQNNLTIVHQAYPSKVASFWPNYVASTLGLYAKQGLEVQDVIVDPQITVSTLIGGSTEMSYADSTLLLLAAQKGANLIAVGLQTERNPYSFMTSPNIKTWNDLKGKRIGAAGEIDVYTYVIKQMLKKNHIDPDKDVEFVFGGGQNQRLTAEIGGAINAGLFSPPSDARLKSQGFNTLAFAPDYAGDLSLSVESVRRDWADQHPDVLRKMMEAQTEAVRWLNNPANKAQALQILETATNATPADAQQAYDYYIGKHIWPNACVNPKALANVATILHTTGQLTTLSVADSVKFTDSKYCPK